MLDCESSKSKLLEAEDEAEATGLKHKTAVKEMRQEVERLEIKTQNIQCASDQLTMQLEFKACEVERLKSCLCIAQEKLIEVETKLNIAKRNDASKYQRSVLDVYEMKETGQYDELMAEAECATEENNEIDDDSTSQVSFKVQNSICSTTKMIDKTNAYIINKKKKALHG